MSERLEATVCSFLIVSTPDNHLSVLDTDLNQPEKDVLIKTLPACSLPCVSSREYSFA